MEIDGATVMTILTVFGLFGYLWWWGRQPNEFLDKALDKALEDGYEPDSKPILKPPTYQKWPPVRFDRDGDTIKATTLPSEPVEDDPVVAERPLTLDTPVQTPQRVNKREDYPLTRNDAPIKPVVALLQKYGTHALSEAMSIEDLRIFVGKMTSAGYELKKVWPNKGQYHIAYLIFKE